MTSVNIHMHLLGKFCGFLFNLLSFIEETGPKSDKKLVAKNIGSNSFILVFRKQGKSQSEETW